MTSLLLAAILSAAPADLVPPSPAPAAASGASGSIDPAAATRAYLDLLPAEQRAKSNAYFEGGYWLILWNFLWSAAIFVLLLQTGISARMRDLAERATRVRAGQAVLYWAQLALVLEVLGFPLAIYRDYLREHQYGLSNLTFAGWVGEEIKGLLVSIVFGSLAAAALYAVVRRLKRTWWIWGAVVSLVLAAFGTLVAPVLVVPLFNNPKKLEDARVAVPILPYLVALTPVTNSVIRGQEAEADIFGLNASGQPDGFAQSALKLSEYRKLDPGPLEELVFYDHPRGRARIFAAMRWKAEHGETWAAAAAHK